MKYGFAWCRARFYWKAHLLMGYLLSPSWPNRLVNWIDYDVLHRRLFAEFYDTWTLRLHIILYGKWSNIVYGTKKSANLKARGLR